MSAALELVPLIGAGTAAFGTACTAFGAWLKGRSIARASIAASHAKETASEHARDVALVPELMAEIHTMREEQRADREKAETEREKCRAEVQRLRDELDTVLSGQQASREERAALRAEVARLRAELTRWHGAVPAGAD